MKVTCVLGSPRKKGNTARVLGWVEEELRDQGHKVDHLNIVDHKVKGCAECYTCHKHLDKPGCPRKDDVLKVFDRMIKADAIIYASPLFCWGYAAQLKPLIDRHFCLVKEYGTPRYTSFLEGKRAGLLVTCAGPEEGNAELLVEMFKRLMDYSKTSVAGTLVIPFTTTPDAMGEEILKRAQTFAHDIAGKPR